MLLFCVPTVITAAQSAASEAADAELLADIGLSDQAGPLAINRIVEAAEAVVDNLEASAQIRVSTGISKLLLTANRPSEALGWVTRARDYARSSGNRSTGSVLASLELRRADVLIQLGRVEEAREAARLGRDSASDRGTRVAAIAIMAKAYAAEGRMREAQDILRGIDVVASEGTLPPDTLYHMYTSAIALGEDSTASRTRARLVEAYPDSPEALLLREGGEPPVFAALSPTAIARGGFSVAGPQAELRAEPPAEPQAEPQAEPPTGTKEAPPSAADLRTYVQVGSFRDRENAQYMRSDMEAMGFTAEVRSKELSESTYYQVLIPVMPDPDETSREAVQQVVVELKERGYEGFLVSE